jgi:hypothetical protein
MPLAERRLRWERLMACLRRNPLETWSDRFLDQLRQAPPLVGKRIAAGPFAADAGRPRPKALRVGARLPEARNGGPERGPVLAPEDVRLIGSAEGDG